MLIRTGLLIFTLLAGYLLSGCHSSTASKAETSSTHKPTAIRWTGQSYELVRNGQPYFIQGAGGKSHFERLKACGGNSIRIWDDLDADQMLAQAQQLDLTVLFGIWVGKEADGFDYHDRQAVDQQFEQIRKTVLKYRNHPALLMWCVGNEWAQDANNFGVFDEVNRIAAMIHELDPNHPVTTAIAPDSGRAIWLVRERCPEIDILSFNVYGTISSVSQYLKEGGWTKPYLISEFGAKGYWEEPHTPWETTIEPTSQQKYEFIRQTYTQYIGSRPTNCLGSYMFYWGAKQEDTHTWFSMFDEQGRETSLVGLMQELWTKQPPANQAPIVQQLRIDGSIKLTTSWSDKSGIHQAQVLATDPDSDSLAYYWEIKPAARRTADYIDTPIQSVDGLIRPKGANSIGFSLPLKPGTYRLFVFVYDTHHHVATANVPFLVTAGNTNQ
ncbi:glycoside hydrolase family 2 TIM barrel-domain containing protein [Spirosoma gilvum]